MGLVCGQVGAWAQQRRGVADGWGGGCAGLQGRSKQHTHPLPGLQPTPTNCCWAPLEHLPQEDDIAQLLNDAQTLLLEGAKRLRLPVQVHGVLGCMPVEGEGCKAPAPWSAAQLGLVC